MTIENSPRAGVASGLLRDRQADQEGAHRSGRVDGVGQARNDEHQPQHPQQHLLVVAMSSRTSTESTAGVSRKPVRFRSLSSLATMPDDEIQVTPAKAGRPASRSRGGHRRRTPVAR